MIVELILFSVSGIGRGTPVDNSIRTTVGPLVGASIDSELIGKDCALVGTVSGRSDGALVGGLVFVGHGFRVGAYWERFLPLDTGNPIPVPWLIVD